MAKAVKDNKTADTKPPAEKKPKKEKKAEEAPERAIFKPNHPFSWGGKQHEDKEIRLTHAQVEAEIKLGMHKAGEKRSEPAKPNSAILNHCTLVSAGEDTKEALKKLGV